MGVLIKDRRIARRVECAPRAGQDSFDRLPGVVVLELGRAQIAERGMESASVVNLVDEAWKIGCHILEGFVVHQIDGLDPQWLCGEHLVLPDRSRRFDINDDRVLDIDQIVGGVSEEGLSTMGSGPARLRIGRRDELWRALSDRPASRYCCR